MSFAYYSFTRWGDRSLSSSKAIANFSTAIALIFSTKRRSPFVIIKRDRGFSKAIAIIFSTNCDREFYKATITK
jgi:hypothetical protein